MSELMNAQKTERDFRWRLLTSVSALALLASVTMHDAKADGDTDRPTVWIELGGQMENIAGQGAPFAPAFLAANPTSPVLNSVTPLQAQQLPTFSFGEEGKILFQPEGSDWIFSAAIRYSRSSNARDVDHQTHRSFHNFYYNGVAQSHIITKADFADTQAHSQESHAILDFSAGKDIGIGMFGKDSTSAVSLGVRIAQFTSKASVDMRARPDMQLYTFPSAAAASRIIIPYFHTYHATGNASRSFRGAGPSLSWNASAPFVGNPRDGEMTVDWGVNAAILFGRQKAHVRHQESSHNVTHFDVSSYYYAGYQHPPRGHDTDRSVTVPNVGGSVGLSWRVQDFKVSMGYRADFFFGAIDGGIDVRKSETLGFKGPFATISVGIGG